MDEAYRVAYARLHREHWWWRSREDLIVETLRRLDVGGRGNVLDVGCGAGVLFPRLAELGEVEGVEVDAATARSDPTHAPRIHVGRFDPSFEPGKRYALILLLDVLEHMEDPLSALQHAVRLLDDRGAIVATVPAFDWLWTSHDELNHHLRRYSRSSFERLARAAGMRISSSRYFFRWLVAAKLAVRAVELLRPTAPRPPRVPPGPVNRALYRLSRGEEALLGRLPLPLGTSLLVVGRRGG
jgi:2-polyprenyl-3-methyl-5-hydroxy-6-metoxy-1,4-benzoquinol methylase